MATDRLQLEAELREPGSSNEARRIRTQGKVPAVLYGSGRDPQPITVESRKVIEILRSEQGQNSILNLAVPGTKKTQTAMILEYQVDALTHRMLHADFVRIAMDEALEIDVPIELVGEARGVTIDHGVLDFIQRDVRVRCLPGDIPDNLKVDISDLSIGDVMQINGLEVPEGVEILDEMDKPIISIGAPRAIEEVVVEEEEEIPFGETVEPELIRPDREDEGEEEG